MTSLSARPPGASVGQPLPHESAMGHVTGSALYVDDLINRFSNLLHAWPVQSPHPHALITRLDPAPALAVPGVVHVLTESDVPGNNYLGVAADEPLFPTEVMYRGHNVCWVLAETMEAARLGAEAVVVDYDVRPAIMTIDEAIEAESYLGEAVTLVRGDIEAALAEAPHVFEGEVRMGGQEHFYLETQASLAWLDSSGDVFVESSTQHPTHCQDDIREVLGRPSSQIVVQSLRMGGAFGGKEAQSRIFAAVAALGAVVTRRPVRVRLARYQDITMTGKRHPYLGRWKAAFDSDGRILGLQAQMFGDGGFCLDQSIPILERSVTQMDNAYFIPNVDLTGRALLTHKTSQTSFRGFGTPQAMVVIEDVMSRAAAQLQIDPTQIRSLNMYQAGQQAPYGQEIRHPERLHRVWDEVLQRSDFAARRDAVEEFNRRHPHTKRGLAAFPMKYGISYDWAPLNQSGALVHVYKDGSVLINHGGTEMGQGLHTKMIQVAATALGVPVSIVHLAPTRTDKVPNTWATAASSGSDLNGAAVKDACETIRHRMARVASLSLGVVPDDVCFADGRVFALGRPETTVPFAQVAMDAYLQRVSLSSTGFYRTQGIYRRPGNLYVGEPYKYWVFAAAVAEVEVDRFNGTYRLLRTDIVFDVGDSLSPLVDRGQVEGGFVQGAGLMTLEDLRWDTSDGPDRGLLTTSSASTYKIPSLGEMPPVFNVHFLQGATETGAVYGSKAIGEPPLVLGVSVREALRAAAAAFGPSGRELPIDSPATPERVYWAIRQAIDAGDAAPSPKEREEERQHDQQLV